MASTAVLRFVFVPFCGFFFFLCLPCSLRICTSPPLLSVSASLDSCICSSMKWLTLAYVFVFTLTRDSLNLLLNCILSYEWVIHSALWLLVSTDFFSFLGGVCSSSSFFYKCSHIAGFQVSLPLFDLNSYSRPKHMETLYVFYLCSSFTTFKVSFLCNDLAIEFIIFPAAWMDRLRKEHCGGTESCERPGWGGGRVERWWGWRLKK